MSNLRPIASKPKFWKTPRSETTFAGARLFALPPTPSLISRKVKKEHSAWQIYQVKLAVYASDHQLFQAHIAQFVSVLTNSLDRTGTDALSSLASPVDIIAAHAKIYNPVVSVSAWELLHLKLLRSTLPRYL